VRLAAQTHSVSTDLRYLKLTHTSPSAGQYSLTAPPSIQVLTPGYWMLYAVDAAGVWSVARMVQVTNETLLVVTNVRVAQLTVGTSPRTLALAPDGRLWVVNAQSATISFINTTTFTVVATVILPPGLRPHGLVFSSSGTPRAWLALEEASIILELNPTDGAMIRMISMTGPARHLSLSADATRLYAPRFIAPTVPGESTATPNLNGRGGQIVVINTLSSTVQNTMLLNPSTAPDTETSSYTTRHFPRCKTTDA